MPEKFNVYTPKMLYNNYENSYLAGDHMTQAIPVVKHCLWLIEATPDEGLDNIAGDTKSTLTSEPMHEELSIEIAKEYNIPCSSNGLQIFSAWAGSRHHAPLIATICSDEYNTADVRENVIISIPGRSVAVLFQFAQMGIVKLSFNASFRLKRKHTYPLPNPVVNDSPVKISKLYDGRSVLSRFGQSLHLESKNMWIFGGYSLSHGPLNDIRHYDRESGMWVPLTITVVQSEEAVPAPRYFHGGTLTPSSTIVVQGGITANLTFLSDTWKFETRTSRWSKFCEGSETPKLAGQTLTVKPEGEGYIIYLIGGFNPVDGFSDRVYIHVGSSTECWQPFETSGAPPIGLYGHSAVYHQKSDTIYVTGGILYESHQVTMSSRLFSLHLPTKRWSVLPPNADNFRPQAFPFPPKKMLHSAVSTDSFMLIIGGSGNTRNVSMIAYVYACNSWQVLNHIENLGDLNRVAGASAIYGHQVLTMGGLRQGSATESVYQISLPEDILCSIHDTRNDCIKAAYCSSCSSDKDPKELCYKSELEMPEKCSTGAKSNNIYHYTHSNKSCSTHSFEEHKCERLRTCGECLAVWPNHPNSSQVNPIVILFRTRYDIFVEKLKELLR